MWFHPYLVVITLTLLGQGDIQFKVTPAQNYPSAKEQPLEFIIAPIPKMEPAAVAPTKPEIAKPKNRIIYFFTQQDCKPCQSWLKNEAPKLKAKGYIIDDHGSVNIVVIDVNKYPKLADAFDIKSTPAFYGLLNGVSLCHRDEYLTAEDVEAMYQCLNQELADSLKRSKTLTRKPLFLRGGPSWTWPGNLAHHLKITHGIDTDGLSHQELEAVHNALHNGYYAPGQINANIQRNRNIQQKYQTNKDRKVQAM